MDLQEISKALVAGARDGSDTENLDKLYAPNAVSVEAMDFGDGREVRGIDAIKGKHEWWNSAFEVLEADVGGPFPHGPDRFAVIYKMKTKNRQTGEVSDMEEVGLYHVAGGKIVREEFFYGE
ncbi:MAG: nuclear transport factor 2 family protein [Pseudomonadota bacterium]